MKYPVLVGAAILLTASSLAMAQNDPAKPASPAVATEITPAKAADTSAGAFTSIVTGDDLSSRLVGLDIYDTDNEKIGTIKDIAFTASGVKAYIVGVGGFLGVDQHYVAVRPSAITLSRDSDSKWHAVMSTDADQLKAAPEYKYPT